MTRLPRMNLHWVQDSDEDGPHDCLLFGGVTVGEVVYGDSKFDAGVFMLNTRPPVAGFVGLRMIVRDVTRKAARKALEDYVLAQMRRALVIKRGRT